MKVWETLILKNTKLTKSEGCRVWDSNGNSYLDLQSGYWCNVLGYGNPDFIEPLKEQISRLINVMSAFRTEEIDIALSELRLICPPELSRVAFLNSGSEAVDLALKMARAATSRTGMVVNEKGYYGATSYTLALSGVGLHASYLPDPGEVHRIPAPLCNNCEHGSRIDCKEFQCLGMLQSLVDSENDNIAAIMYEPVGGGGILVPPLGYGKKLREFADLLGAFLISEEVTTGMGRTGRWFGFQHDDIVPDILVLGKAVGAGFPVSVVVTTDEVQKRCKNTLQHVQSHQNDAFTGRIVGTVISVIKKHGLVNEAAMKGEYFINALRSLMEEFPHIVDVRGRGLMIGVELSPDHSHLGDNIQESLLKAGYLMDFHGSTNTFRFFPPYIISYEEIDLFITAFRETLASIN